MVDSLSRSCQGSGPGILGGVDDHVRRALDCIAAAEAQVAAMPPTVLTEEYLRMVRAVEALPENQSGADKSHVWRIYEYCRRHFAKAKLQ